MPQQRAGDVPANPVEKAGYTLEFADEFDGESLDTTKWLPFHLPQWSSRQLAAPNYALADGYLTLLITADQQPWCPEFDGNNRCSSLQTGVFAGPLGGGIGQHRFSKALVVRETQQNRRTYTPQYGYFETRLRAVAGAGTHISLWMIGYEDRPERSGEIAICEIMGAHITPQQSRIGYGLHPWSDPTISDEFYEDFFPIDARDFHIYAAEWRPTGVDFYLDNRKTRTIAQSPQYPMQFMLGMYYRPDAATESAAAFPKQFVVDYFRAYQPEDGYQL